MQNVWNLFTAFGGLGEKRFFLLLKYYADVIFVDDSNFRRKNFFLANVFKLSGISILLLRQRVRINV